ncbi:MAG: tetratricopeptide repeat protein [Myxococcota bacterium]|nr:tetratricopeptide repeat protein [Myxococcota bacterium]
MPSFVASFLKYILRRLPPPQEQVLRELTSNDRKGPSFSVSIATSPLEEGRRHFEQGNWMEALAMFHLATQKNSQDHWAWHGKGDAFQLLGDYENAQAAYEKAIELSSSTALHYGALSNALKEQRLLDEADAVWKKALEMDPSLTWMRSKSS